MNKNGDLSTCLKCRMPIEYIDPQDGKPGVWRHNHMSLETPHAARMVNQFRVEEGAEGTRKHFVSTGKVMCWCNCGETTEWLDILTENQKIQDWLSEHNGVKEELGLRFYYWIGELAGYSIETSSGNYGDLETELVHRCGWRKELPIDADKLLTNIIMEAQSNNHICGEVKQ